MHVDAQRSFALRTAHLISGAEVCEAVLLKTHRRAQLARRFADSLSAYGRGDSSFIWKCFLLDGSSTNLENMMVRRGHFHYGSRSITVGLNK